MWIWIALIIAPLLALADQSIAFSLVGWSCAHQSVLLLHVCHLAFLLLLLGCASAVARTWLRTQAGTQGATEQLRQHHFLAGVGTIVAALSCLTVIAMWVPTWMVSACVA